LKIDLHSHSHCSDGSLSPKELLFRAEKSEIDIFSITDHDTCAAYDESFQLTTDIKLITGVEFSTRWNKIGIHILALNFDLTSKSIQATLCFQQQARRQRAELIAQKLSKIGLHKALEKIQNKSTTASSCAYIGRPDFAKLLVEEGVVKDLNHAFKKYLGAGKIGDIKNKWMPYEAIVKSIQQAGGMAVLAHPLSYKLSNAKLRRLLADFKASGGQGLEVVNGYQNADKTNYLCQLCNEFDLKASLGSDFHHDSNWSSLGCSAKLISDCQPLWDEF